MRERKPIFYDARQARWRRTRRMLEITGALLALLLLVFSYQLYRNPNLPKVLEVQRKPAEYAARQKPAPKAAARRVGRHRRIAAIGKIPAHYDPLRVAFYVPWDPSSFASLRQHFREIDVLVPEALHAVSPDGSLRVAVDHRLTSWMEANDIELPVMSLVNNSDGTVWHIKELAELLASSPARKRLVDELISYAMGMRQAGLVVDFEDVPDASQPHLREFVKELAFALHRINLKLLVALPAADPSYEYRAIAASADAIILMNYDQHWLTSPSGPIASQEWCVRNIENVLKEVPREKLIIAVGNYAYDWTEPQRGKPARPTQATSYQQAVVTAMESESSLDFDPDSLNPHFSYLDEQNRLHNVWLLDGVTAYNQLRAAERLGVHGTALWRLGTEDVSLWSIWDTVDADQAVREKLRLIPPGYDLILEGDGDIWRIKSTPQNGARDFRFDPASALIISETLTRPPLSYTIDQLPASPRQIALTFDDGPDPGYSPKILDILRDKNVSAAFFITGRAANDYPSLLQRIFNEGHELGNHTYTHPHFTDVSRTQLKLELNLTQRLFESRLAIRTILFRPPYGIDHQPETADEIAMLPLPQELGYVLVGSRIDPHDWGEPGGAPPASADIIAARVLQQARAGKGNIVLLHDGGGDRSHTVAALPKIIDGLRAAGFTLVPVSQLLGQTRAQVMPPLTRNEWLLARADAFMFALFHWFRLVFLTIFIAGIVLVSGRALIIGILALIEKLRPAEPPHPDFCPSISVLIPAHNEEECIVETVRSALDSELPPAQPPLEIIVVDDGSTDRTGNVLHEQFDRDPRVRIIRQQNSGKAAALNRALMEAKGEIIVTIDADTYSEPDAIARLARHFADPRIGGVAGNVKVGNRSRWLTRWQALEYITSQNLEKRAFDLLNCITVVPGALGAWRAQAVLESGGLSPDTVAEDTDLTIAMRRRGWRIPYDEEAIAWTQAPETAAALINQRFRWTFGTLQSVWKHRDTLFRWRHGTLGFIALPNIFLFQFLLPLVSPVIDLLFLLTMVLWGLAQFRITQVPQLWTNEDVERSLAFFALFMLVDLLTCTVAFALEKHEDWSLLMPLLLQRFYYRQLMYVVLFRAIMRAVQGGAVGWRGPLSEKPVEVAS